MLAKWLQHFPFSPLVVLFFDEIRRNVSFNFCVVRFSTVFPSLGLLCHPNIMNIKRLVFLASWCCYNDVNEHETIVVLVLRLIPCPFSSNWPNEYSVFPSHYHLRMVFTSFNIHFGAEKWKIEQNHSTKSMFAATKELFRLMKKKNNMLCVCAGLPLAIGCEHIIKHDMPLKNGMLGKTYMEFGLIETSFIWAKTLSPRILFDLNYFHSKLKP